jgi:hypothetical protein
METRKLNFTVSPVMSSEKSSFNRSKTDPVFKTLEFLNLILENEKIMLGFAKVSDTSNVLFMIKSFAK